MGAPAISDDHENAKAAPDSGARIRVAPRGIRRIPDLEVREVDEPAEIRRRQLSGQKVAEIRVAAAPTPPGEPVALPVRRLPSSAIAIAVAAAFAVFGVSLGARARAPLPRAQHVEQPARPAEAATTTAEAPVVTRPAPVAPKPKTRMRAR